MKTLDQLRSLSPVELQSELVAGQKNYAMERLKSEAERSRDSFCLRKHRRYVARIKTLLTAISNKSEA